VHSQNACCFCTRSANCPAADYIVAEPGSHQTMPIISPDSLDTSIKHGKIEPLYFLFGEEEFLIEESLDRIVAAAVDESTRSFNFDLLHGSEATINDVIDRAQSYPLMSERRVVVVKELDRIFSLRGKPDAASPFARYLANPLPSTTLVMTAATSDFLTKGKSGSGAKAPYDAIVGNATSVQFKKIYDRELPSWVASRIKARGKEITPEGVELFVGYTGSALRVLHNEIEKLFTYVEDRKRITVDDVRAVVGTSKTYNVFELQKAVGAKQLELAVEIAVQMLRAGEPEQLILTMLTRYFTILWRLPELRSTTRDQNELARSVGISSFFIAEYLAASAKYSVAQVQNAFEALLHADITLKSTNASPSTVLQMMLVSIIQGDSSVMPAQSIPGYQTA
jgi:DNA polymerase-3 subunit delta